MSRKGQTATSVAAMTCTKLVIGDVAGESHTIGDTELGGVVAELLAAGLASLDRRADKHRHDVRRQLAERLEQEAMAPALDHETHAAR